MPLIRNTNIVERKQIVVATNSQFSIFHIFLFTLNYIIINKCLSFLSALLTPLRFKLKYHPEDSVKRHDEQKSSLQKRVDVFESFWKMSKFESVSIDGDKSEPILKLLDSVVILLEGGSDNDLKVVGQTKNFPFWRQRMFLELIIRFYSSFPVLRHFVLWSSSDEIIC